MNKVKYLLEAIRGLIFIIILLILWFSIVLIYVFIFSGPRGSLWDYFILGGGGYYSIIFANKISIKITNRFITKQAIKEKE